MARKSRKNSSDEPQMKVYKAAIYARLSREGQATETIETQIEEVKAHLKVRPFFQLVEVYADDGYSGTNFKRPAFERLMEDIRNAKIDCIIVKDLSRFGRNHIAVDEYLSNIFPFLGVRFIAVRDGYDNINVEPQEYFLVSFKNFAHAFFAQETSRKASMAKRALQEQGKYIGSRPPFGYKKDPADKHKLVIDEETAPIVREIFRRSADGELPTKIANDLNTREILTGRNAMWTHSRLHNLLTKEAYIGTLVQHAYEISLYKNIPFQSVPKDEHIRFENAFPAIIDREVWEKVQANIAARANPRYDDNPENIYKSYVFCGHCGYRAGCRLERRKPPPFYVFGCKNCKEQNVYATGKILDTAVRGQLNLPENAEISRDLITENFSKILVFNRDNIVFEGGDMR